MTVLHAAPSYRRVQPRFMPNVSAGSTTRRSVVGLIVEGILRIGAEGSAVVDGEAEPRSS
jgi:hypothetical protein